jgi:hypothetical protein
MPTAKSAGSGGLFDRHFFENLIEADTWSVATVFDWRPRPAFQAI